MKAYLIVTGVFWMLLAWQIPKLEGTRPVARGIAIMILFSLFFWAIKLLEVYE